MAENTSDLRVQDLLSRIKQPKTKTSMAPITGGRKISLKDATFSFLEGGSEVLPATKEPLEVIIIKAAPISRTYYSGEYDEANPASPICWADDTRTGRPTSTVAPENIQSESCFDCKWNIKGSGKHGSRACRFHQRIVVMLVAQEDCVMDSMLYQLQLPATSVFGDNPQKMAMQVYARHLNAHKTPLASVVTELYLERLSEILKLLFRPKRKVTEEEFSLAVCAQKNPETNNVLLNTMSLQSPFSSEEGFTFKQSQ